jgi:ABC-2 type transport system permease protein
MATVTERPPVMEQLAPPSVGNVSSLRVIRVIWLREVIAYSRDRARLISALIMPLLMIVIFGEGFGQSVNTFEEGIDYRQFIYPGIVAMTVLTTAVFGGISIIWDREFGFLREMLVAPISRTAIGVGKLLGGASISVVQASVLFVLAPLLGVHLSPIVLLKLWGLMLILALAMSAVGIVIASKVRTAESFQMVTQMTIMPAMFLSGIFFPINNVPVFLEILAKINPVTYAVAPIREVALHSQIKTPASTDTVVNVEIFGHVLSSFESLAIVIAFGVVLLMIAIRSFQARN